MSHTYKSSNGSIMGYITKNSGSDDLKVTGDLNASHIKATKASPGGAQLDISGQVGIGTKNVTLDSTSALHIDSDSGTKCLVLPTHSAAITTTVEGSVYYDTVTKKLMVFDGSTWLACN